MVNQTFDIVFDAVGKSSFGKCKPLLKKEESIYQLNQAICLKIHFKQSSLPYCEVKKYFSRFRQFIKKISFFLKT